MPQSCVCGSGAAAAACCAGYHRGVAAPTALALMRSRYAAFVLGEIDYLIATHAGPGRAALDVAALREWSTQTAWLGLEIVATERGLERDDRGVVEFIAHGVPAGARFAQRERSRFERTSGRWFYVGGRPIAEPPVRGLRPPAPAKNAPCPCGSGAKFKRCHGA